MSHKWTLIIQFKPAIGRKSAILSGVTTRDGRGGVGLPFEDVPWQYWDCAAWLAWDWIWYYSGNESAMIELVEHWHHKINVKNSRQKTRQQIHPRRAHITQNGCFFVMPPEFTPPFWGDCNAATEDLKWRNGILLLTSAKQPLFFITIYLSLTLLPGKSASVCVAIMLREHFKQTEVIGFFGKQ